MERLDDVLGRSTIKRRQQLTAGERFGTSPSSSRFPPKPGVDGGEHQVVPSGGLMNIAGADLLQQRGARRGQTAPNPLEAALPDVEEGEDIPAMLYGDWERETGEEGQEWFEGSVAPAVPPRPVAHKVTTALPVLLPGPAQLPPRAKTADSGRLPPGGGEERRSSAGSVPHASGTPCSICKGMGYLRSGVPYYHPAFGQLIACKCKEAERREKRQRQLQELSNLDSLSDKQLTNFNYRVFGVQEAFKEAVSFAEGLDGWLILIGRTGCGKTHLAAAVANEVLAHGVGVYFATVPDLLDHLRATFAPNAPVTYDYIFDAVRQVELLVLDDLGTESSSPWAREKLYQLLNHRYNLRLPTLITTNNLCLQTIEERIRSRMMDTSLSVEVVFRGAADYRLHNVFTGSGAEQRPEGGTDAPQQRLGGERQDSGRIAEGSE